MTARELIRLVLLAILLLLIQTTLGLDLRIEGIHPDLMLLLPIAAGLVGGAERGALVGFGTGILTDLLLPTPFGLSALVYCLVGFVIGYAIDGTSGPDSRQIWWLSPLVALAASAAGAMLYAVFGAVLGQEQMVQLNLVSIVCVVAIVNAALAPLAVSAMGWALDMEPARRGRRRRRLQHRRSW